MRLNSWIIVIIGVVATGLMSIITRMAAKTGIDPVSFSVSTLLASVFFFGAFMYFPGKGIVKSMKKVSRPEWLKLAYLAIAATIIGMNLYYIGTGYTTAINASFLVRLQSPFMFVFALLMLNDRISKKHLISMALVLVGAYLLTMKGLAFELQLGDVMVIVSAIIFAYTNIYFKKNLAHLSAQHVLFYRYALSAPILFIGGYLIGGPGMFSSFFIAPFLVVGGALCYSVYMFGLYHGIDKLGSSPTAIAMLASPLITVLAAFTILGEGLVAAQFAGVALMLIGGYVLAK